MRSIALASAICVPSRGLDRPLRLREHALLVWSEGPKSAEVSAPQWRALVDEEIAAILRAIDGPTAVRDRAIIADELHGFSSCVSWCSIGPATTSASPPDLYRSEEHTSELQSPMYLV